jgi:diaminopropionate ammonia-lyase
MLLTEALEQAKGIWPTHVFVQAGVGSLAASLLAFLCSFVQKVKPVFTLVEPEGAPCFFNSIQAGDGKPHRIHGDLKTIMAGLACGKPSQTGWEILKTGTDAFIICSDEIARRGMRILGNPSGDDKHVISGESGAVTLGLVYELLSNARYDDIKDNLHLKKDSKILLFSTEGDTDPEHYPKVVWGP